MIQYLLIQAGGCQYGLAAHQVLLVADGFELYPTPSAHPAVRGVTPVRDRLVPLVDLARLLRDSAAAATDGETVVLVQAGDTLIALQVDDAHEVVSGILSPVPNAWRLPWASGVDERGDALVPILDMELLAERLVPATARGRE
ncbi:MAG: chemotaxis protein CheW [Gemmatimonadota bacterium]|nr:MAG: chemotaxis protein CheW [Gemmatimonadota bacterium]